MAAEDDNNYNITNNIKLVPIILDEAPYMVIDEEIDSEGEPDPLGEEGNVHDIERDRTVMVENVDEEEEVDTAVNIIFPNRQRRKTTIFEPKIQGKR